MLLKLNHILYKQRLPGNKDSVDLRYVLCICSIGVQLPVFESYNDGTDSENSVTFM